MFDKEYIIKMRQLAKESVRTFNSDEENRAMMKDEHHGDEPGYEGVTFLYIRAYDGDKGIRPIPAGINYWLSPDIELYKGGVLVDTTNPLVANTDYTVQVSITNDGDLDCNSCTIDLYLCDVSIGFSVNGSQLIGILNTPVMAHSTATVEIPFTTTATMNGHRCMFARVYSLINNDYPEDFVNFPTYLDRHIGQQNLNIVKQGESFHVNLDRMFGRRRKNLEVLLKPDLTVFKRNIDIQKKFVETRMDIDISRFKLAREITVAKPDIGIKPDLNIKPNISERIRNNIDPPILKPTRNINFRDAKFENLKPKLDKNIKLEEITHLDTGRWLHQFDSGINKIKVDVPMLNLKENEAVPMSLIVKDPETGEIIGGITVLVVG